MQQVIDYLKIDIEASEWDTFETMLRMEDTTHQLSKIKQLGLEIHMRPSAAKEYNDTRVQDYIRYQKILLGLHSAGFRMWDCHKNPLGLYEVQHRNGVMMACCYELIFINVNYM